MYTCIHTYIHTYIHAYIQTNTHTEARRRAVELEEEKRQAVLDKLKTVDKKRCAVCCVGGGGGKKGGGGGGVGGVGGEGAWCSRDCRCIFFYNHDYPLLPPSLTPPPHPHNKQHTSFRLRS